MANELNSSTEQNSPNINEDDAEKSLVGKFKSIISNTPLSKWFRRQNNSKSTIRRREDDEESNEMQPPSKRARLPDSAGSGFINLFSGSVLDNNAYSDTFINKTHNYFSEPVAGPSGLKTHKVLNSVTTNTHSAKNLFNNDLLNGNKDSDSEESTSGYSSVARIGNKEQASHSEGSSKQPSPLQTNSPNIRSLFQSPAASANRSLFAERTGSPKLNTSLSSRRPCFSASTFGSPNFLDRTISTEKIINSPFYNGTTMYGGASAYGKRFGKGAKDSRASIKRSVHIKPINKTRQGGGFVLGKTARKILETLEQYNTPVNDAKKIPVASKRFRPDDSLLGSHIGVNPYLKQKRSALTTELQVPTVSDLLKMKQKVKLQTSTETVRQIAISAPSDSNKRSETDANSSPKPSLHVSNASKSPRLKEKEDVQSTKAVEKPNEAKKSKSITPAQTNKPQSTASLPSSNLPQFVIQPASPIREDVTDKPFAETPASKQPRPNEPRDCSATAPKDTSPYKFSNPLVIAENLKSIVAVNNFKFSEPLSKCAKPNSAAPPTKGKNNGQTTVKDAASNSSLFDKFKPAAGTWECPSCLVRNQPDKGKCAACGASASKATAKPSFGDKFAKQDDVWVCPACLIRNGNDRSECAACETPNPETSAPVSSSNSLSKFLPRSNTWECSTCMIRNDENLGKCVACETPRIAKSSASEPLTNAFKTKDDEWRCEVCLIMNKSDRGKCQCCEASKPGTSTNVVVKDCEKRPTTKFNFGIDQKSAASFSFGIPPSAKAPGTLGTAPAVAALGTVPPALGTVPAALGTVPGALGAAPKAPATVPAAPATFSFGVTPKAQEKEKTDEPDKKKLDSKTALPEPVAAVKPDVIVPEKSFKFTPATTMPVASATTGESSNVKSPIKSNNVEALPKPSFNFGSSFEKKDTEAKSTVSFEPPKNALSKEPEPPKPVQSPAFSFGANNSFGQNKSITLNKSASEAKAAPTFGTLPGSSFGSAKPGEVKPFSFGKFSKDEGPAAAAKPAFNFGSSASGSPAAPSSGFNFGSIAKAPAGGGFNSAANKNGIFTFGAAAATTTPAAPPNSAPKAGFNFSAAPAPSFNFGAGGSQPAASTQPLGGFTFTAAFDANAKPSYNFSDKPVAFSASPVNGGLLAPRKMRKATRKTQQR
ncbi:unnamed protein product [Phyllotreta striolata]|uniref:Nuclear pore complex protein Nup153 n=1 Tax=Phyllotreta striolata TaxID=444603 RepID=A0A9N9XHQ2_PHYSR|nr:unnamed protein product [Phyllotreta striolata]